MRFGNIVWQRCCAVFMDDRERIGRGVEINIPYPVIQPLTDYDLYFLSKQDRCSLFKFPAGSYESCPLIWFSCRREKKDLYFCIAVFFDPETLAGSTLVSLRTSRSPSLR